MHKNISCGNIKATTSQNKFLKYPLYFLIKTLLFASYCKHSKIEFLDWHCLPLFMLFRNVFSFFFRFTLLIKNVKIYVQFRLLMFCIALQLNCMIEFYNELTFSFEFPYQNFKISAFIIFHL